MNAVGRFRFSISVICLIVGTIVGVINAACSADVISGDTDGTGIFRAGAFDCDSIGHCGPEQWRWLSVPGSRIVLNPSLITERSAPLCPALALHAGYYEGDHPQRLQQLLSLRVLETASSPNTGKVWRKKLTPTGAWVSEDGDWTFQDVLASTDGYYGTVSVSDGGDPWGWASYTVRPPFRARSGFIRIHVPGVDRAWALKMGHASLDTDLYVQYDTQRPGVYTYDLSRIEGWQGLETFELKFFAVGEGCRATLDFIEIELREEAPDLGLASSVQSCWYPHQLTFEASYAAPDAQIQGTDFFADENTVVRMLNITNRSAHPLALMFEGCPYAEDYLASGNQGALSFIPGDYACGIRFARKTGYGNYESIPFTLTRGMQWRAEVPVQPGKTDLAVVLSFAVGENASALTFSQALEVAASSIDERLRARKNEWDGYLARVPAPERFGIEDIDAKGVTADDHRRAYYAAWAFVIQNVLPPMPENDYGHAQTPTGKPSLWAEGSSRAKASAAWESFFAQQLLVFVEPEIAWDAFEGIMMQVDEDGWLDGEVLPSRKAQTAWMLYDHTRDKKRLEKVYPPVSRYLRWREKNPRWIYKEHDNPHQRDSNFVDSLLLDLDFAVRIAEALDEDPTEWHAMKERVTKDYLRWFFHDDLPHPVQYFYEDTGERHAGHATWVCSGLYLDGLPEPANRALMALFDSMYNPDHDLGGLDFCKHPIASMIVHGLYKKGRIKEAEAYAQALIRDVIRAGRFSENYSFNPLRSWGVEDSMFGAATVIEFTLLLNKIDKE